MKLKHFLTTACIALIASCSNKASDHALVLKYGEPSKVWTDALPVGNGLIGAMIYGNATAEHLQLNEKPCTLVAPLPFKVAGVTAEPYELARKTLYKASFETEARKTYKLSI